MAHSENAAQIARMHESAKKIFFFGDHQSGKSSIVQKLMGHQDATSQSKYEESFWKVYLVEQQPHIINIIDTGSLCSPLAMQRFGSAVDCAFVLVYACDNERSFKTVERVQAQIRSLRCANSVPPMIIVCNKTDSLSNKNPQLPRLVVTQELAVKTEWGVDFVHVSARTGYGVCELAWILLQRVFNTQLDFDGLCAENSPDVSNWKKIWNFLTCQSSTPLPLLTPLAGFE
ncbi:hypothetical protein CAPTEDRAFT_200527 [Capitella teleta]|uniref:Small monomeric GTPase n=1 Tax=Capitella teleta TaxID=283909 RepID=R7U8F3_CAPTE|nr:hypothetical protein CAPTEDRAFT_200527 [Capitella teleta]|eukprot:ELT99961.1 hypothetical protein CAPTEDRAFT_200527 [Capitella teleta]